MNNYILRLLERTNYLMSLCQGFTPSAVAAGSVLSFLASLLLGALQILGASNTLTARCVSAGDPRTQGRGELVIRAEDIPQNSTRIGFAVGTHGSEPVHAIAARRLP
jgi:hypothetical protein